MKKFEVTITETLKKKVEVEAETQEEAEQIVTDDWYKGEHILDANNFTEVVFEAKEYEPEKIKVVLLEPGKIARTAEIGTSLKDLQRMVGGYIETAHFFDEPVCLVCNEEGKVRELPINRGIYDKNKKLIDVIVGTAFICDCSGEEFGSLSDEQIKKYTKKLMYPEKFYFNGNEIVGKKFNPNNREHER